MWDASDEALLDGYASGDPEASLVFVRRFQGKVYGLATTITGSAVDAEEAAQEAFVRAWRYAMSYDRRRGSVATWLLGVTRNTAIDRTRPGGARREIPFEDVPLEVVQGDDVGDRVSDRDDVARIVAALQALPSEQRETLLAATWFGLTAREISERSDVPLGTVKTHIRRGLRHLREELHMPATL